MRVPSDLVGEGDRAHWIIAALGGLALLAPVAYWIAGTSEKVPSTGPSMRPTLKGPEPLEDVPPPKTLAERLARR